MITKEDLYKRVKVKKSHWTDSETRKFIGREGSIISCSNYHSFVTISFDGESQLIVHFDELEKI